jgi:hypothetical protein
MSIFFENYDGSNDDDQAAYCRVLEQKLHYVMNLLADAKILKGADGKATFVSQNIKEDAEYVQASVQGNQ